MTDVDLVISSSSLIDTLRKGVLQELKPGRISHVLRFAVPTTLQHCEVFDLLFMRMETWQMVEDTEEFAKCLGTELGKLYTPEQSVTVQFVSKLESDASEPKKYILVYLSISYKPNQPLKIWQVKQTAFDVWEKSKLRPVTK